MEGNVEGGEWGWEVLDADAAFKRIMLPGFEMSERWYETGQFYLFGFFLFSVFFS